MAQQSERLPWILALLVAGGVLYRPSPAGGPPEARAQTGAASRSAESDRPAAVPAVVQARLQEPHKDALDLIAEHFGVDVPDQTLASASNEAERDARRLQAVQAALGDSPVHALIATVPDPIDSHVRWMFDPAADALQRAVSDSNFVLDRFYVPDWKPNRPSGASAGLEAAVLHEQWPGVILFRHAHRHELLVVFLVAETATSGVHQPALRRALELTSALDPNAVVRLLGPSFSGSTDSLVHALQTFTAAHSESSIRIVSGGATAYQIRRVIERDVPRTTFRATVLPDRMLLEGVARHLFRLDPTLGSGRRVALLLEGNTLYGRLVLGNPGCQPAAGTSPSQPEPASAEGVDDPDDTADDSGRFSIGHWFKAFWSKGTPCEIDNIINTALQVPFPMHISRLRSETQNDRDRSARSQGVAQQFHALALDEPGTATDQMPALSPKLTASTVELVVANILATLRRERITTVGIIATDARDKLFLAQQIARFAPSVTMFTTESDLLFVHPEYNSYARGMIIGSTYPLFAQNQSWTSRRREIRQRQLFSTTNAEGLYNATLALLNYDVNGVPTTDDRVVLADYRPPAPLACFAAGCIPPVWISVVGRDSLWPIGYALPASGETHAEVTSAGLNVAIAPDPASQVQLVRLGSARRASAVRPSSPMLVLLLLFATVCTVSTAYFWRWQHLQRLRIDPDTLTGFDRGAAAIVYQRVALTALLIGGLFVASVAFIALRITWWNAPSLDQGAYLYTIVSVLFVGGAALRSWLSRDRRTHRVDASRTVRTLRGLILAGSVLVVALAALCFFRYMWTFVAALRTPAALTRYVVRSLQAGNGVSPLVPVLLLTLPIYAWAVVQLWRSGGPKLRAVTTQTWLEPFIGLKPDSWRLPLARLIASATSGLPTSWLAVIVGGFALTAIFVVNLNIVTIEPFAYSWFLVGCWLIMQLFVALSLARSLHAWRLTARLLRGLSSTRLLDAFGRLPKDVFANRSRLSTRSPSRADLLPPARHRRLLAVALDEHARTATAPFGPALASALESFTTAVPTDLTAMEYVPWSDTTAFRVMMNDTGAVIAALRELWTASRADAFLARAKEIETTDALSRWALRAEEYVAMLLTLVIRELLSRIVIGLLFVTVALVLMVAALNSFPIHPWQPLMMFVWLWTLVGAAAGITVATRIEHDPIVSRLSGTAPHRATWNLAFIVKVVAYAFVPIATLFATQFPDVADTLFRWIGPVQPLP